MKNKNINQLLRTVGKNSMLLVVALAHFVDINCNNNNKKKSPVRRYPVQRNVSKAKQDAPVEESRAVVEKNSYQKEISEEPLDPTEKIEPSVNVQMTQLPDGSAVETKTTVEVNEEEGKVVTTVETWTLYDYAKVAAITVGTAAALGGAGYLLYKNNGNFSAAGKDGYDQLGSGFNDGLKNINAAVNSGVEKFNSGVDSAKSWWNGSSQNVPVKQVIPSDSDAQSSVEANLGDADSSNNSGQVAPGQVSSPDNQLDFSSKLMSMTGEQADNLSKENPDFKKYYDDFKEKREALYRTPITQKYRAPLKGSSDRSSDALDNAAKTAAQNGDPKTAKKLSNLAEQVAPDQASSSDNQSANEQVSNDVDRSQQIPKNVSGTRITQKYRAPLKGSSDRSSDALDAGQNMDSSSPESQKPEGSFWDRLAEKNPQFYKQVNRMSDNFAQYKRELGQAQQADATRWR